MSDIYYLNSNQISKSYEGSKHVYPRYGKSTTDPTYYEPAATRIANMKKASGAIMEGLYDFYTKDDVSKFNEKNFSKNIHEAKYDPRFNNTLLREEISQVTTNLGEQVDTMIESKKKQSQDKQNRINEQLEVSKKITEQSEKTE